MTGLDRHLGFAGDVAGHAETSLVRAAPRAAGASTGPEAGETRMLRGLTTVAYHTTDIDAAMRWYTELLGIEPYHDRRPIYVEFRLGDYQHELGLLNDRYLAELGGEKPAAAGPAGAIVYWHVDDVDAALERMVALGATLHQPPRDFGEGFIGASVIDPFGNILGVMRNPHYLEVLSGIVRT